MYYHVPGYGYVQAGSQFGSPYSQTRGHSILKQRTYSPAFHRKPVAFEDVYEPYSSYPYMPKKHFIDRGSEENFLRSEVNRELFLTAAAMEDNYEMAAASRKRDDEILSTASKAIAASETYTSPRLAVASARANRPHGEPIYVHPVVYSSPSRRPTATRSKKEVVVVHAHVLPRYRKRYTPPASTRGSRVTYTPSHYHAHSKSSREDLDTVQTVPRRAPVPWYLPKLELMLLSNLYRARTAAKAPRMRSKAALVGSRVEVVRPAKTHRHPKSKYAQAKLRSMRKEEMAETSIHPETTLGITASRPVGTMHRDLEPEYYYRFPIY